MSKRIPFQQIYDNVPFTRDLGIFHLEQCCDCGLVHNIKYTLTGDGKLVITAARNTTRTLAARKKGNFPCTKR